MSDKKKRFEELIGESVNPEKKPLYSEDFITDKDALKVIQEQKEKEAEEAKALNEQKENIENEVEQFLAENSQKKEGEILSESTKNSDEEIFIINLNESEGKDSE